jgi:hypothetical protein
MKIIHTWTSVTTQTYQNKKERKNVFNLLYKYLSYVYFFAFRKSKKKGRALPPPGGGFC